MCVRVQFVPPDARPTFDADARAIEVPSGLSHAHTVMLVRAILTELVVPQPEMGAVCWCGEPVDLCQAPCMPQQKMSEQVVRTRGA